MLSNGVTTGVDPEHTKTETRLLNLSDHYTKMIHANRCIRASGRYNKDYCKIPVNINFNIQYWESNLQDYYDKEMTQFINFGWPINHDGRAPCLETCTNHRGATDFPVEMDRCIEKEVIEGASLGPLDSDCFGTPIVCSPLNSRPKKDLTDERRLILDLSFPRDRGINQAIDKDTYLGQPAKVCLPNVDTLVRFVKEKGKGCVLYKRDLRRAYRQIHVDPGDIHLLGFKWRDKLYVDCTLPMGLRSAANA